MENDNRVPLGFKEWRNKDGELDKEAPLFSSLYEDLCKHLAIGVVTSGIGTVTTEATMFDYQRTNAREYLLYRWRTTSHVAGLRFSKTTTRYFVAVFERNEIIEILPMPGLKGQAVAWWLRFGQSPIAQLREKEWL